ncbi:MAG: HIT family protein [Candidatus Dormibacteria bacterium]
MDRLWAPWRAEYVAGGPSEGSCFLCRASDEGSGVIDHDAATVTVLNRYPYTTGHVLVAPRQHVADLVEAGDDIASQVVAAVRRALRIIALALSPDGFNVGVNQGAAAGASIEHLHVHVVPRWSGDTNFMPAVGGTRVLPELLEETGNRLRQAAAGLGPG